MEVRTESGNLEFTEPPFPMLDRLLQNAKPIKDGSGVYKVIPVGSTGNDRPKVSTNIYDAAKQINAERIENAKRQYQSIIPDRKAFDDLFLQFADPELNVDFGPAYRDQIWEWFTTTKIPVVQAWSFNAQKIPCISIHLANETEDESKAAMFDLAGVGENADIGTAVFTVMVDVEPIREFEHVHTHPSIGNPESCDVATSLDVNPCDVDRTANKGIIAEPVGIAQSEEEDEYDSFIDPEDITI
ncbi:unnamed protein product [Sphagnum balticum]